MRFKKGAKVEVLSKKEVPSGFWRCAEIICGNGHHYNIRYDGYQDATGEAIVDRVSRKVTRPCPPVLEITENWNPGDVVEVFQDFSWKMAKVLEVLGKKYIMVRILGSSSEFKVSKFDIRVRQSWQDEKWIRVGKGSASLEKGKHEDRITSRHNRISSGLAQKTATNTKFSVHCNYHADKEEMNFLESRFVSSERLKRGCHPQVDGYAEPAQKFRAIQKDGSCHRARVANMFAPFKQVDGVVFPSRDLVGRECIPASVNNRRTEFSERDVDRKKRTGAIGCSFAVNIDSKYADSVTCSVGSCSVMSSNSYKLHFPVHAGPLEDRDGSISDAESVCQRGYEKRNCSLPTQEELAAEIHRLELHAYRCTIEALHASGPLSWEQEALMTNLRLSLHISNDEHLMELRNLISSENCIPIR